MTTSKITKKAKTPASTIGAPAQHNQSSRKGKKAWRKNVDIEDVEDRLEDIRGEERLFGCVSSGHSLHNLVDLFSLTERLCTSAKMRTCLSSTSRVTIKVSSLFFLVVRIAWYNLHLIQFANRSQNSPKHSSHHTKYSRNALPYLPSSLAPLLHHPTKRSQVQSLTPKKSVFLSWGRRIVVGHSTA